MEIRWNDFHFLESGGTKMIGHPASGAFDVRFVLAFGAHTGDSQEFAQLRQMLVTTAFYKFSKVHEGLSGTMSPFVVDQIKFEPYVRSSRVSANPHERTRLPVPILEPGLARAQANTREICIFFGRQLRLGDRSQTPPFCIPSQQCIRDPETCPPDVCLACKTSDGSCRYAC